jgi:glycerol-3-phosphate acyltransferase PlsY
METKLLTFAILSYFVGCIPTGTIFSKIKGKSSLLEPGTRSTKMPGEIFKILGIPTGIIVSLLDTLKGFLVVTFLLKYLLGPSALDSWWTVSLGAMLVVIGHCNSALLGFRGGRGLAPIFGVSLAILPVPAILSCLLGLSLAFWGLSSKPGALSAAGAMPLFSILWVSTLSPNTNINYLYVVAFLSLWTMWEQRDELKNYMGIKTNPAEKKADENLTEKEED